MLDVKAGSHRRGARAILWPGRGQGNQRWGLDPASGRLSPLHAPHLALDVKVRLRAVEAQPRGE